MVQSVQLIRNSWRKEMGWGTVEEAHSVAPARQQNNFSDGDR